MYLCLYDYIRVQSDNVVVFLSPLVRDIRFCLILGLFNYTLSSAVVV